MTVDYSAVPQSLRQLTRWVLYKLVRTGTKWDKVPVSTSGRLASSTDPATWDTWEHAVECVRRFDTSGLGFVLGDGIAGIDLDHVVDDKGEVKPWATKVIEDLNSYTEWSPSRTGFHVIFRGRKPAGSKSNMRFDVVTREGFEFYDFGRYFTVSGDRVPWAPPDVRPVPDDMITAVVLEMEAKLPKKVKATSVIHAAAAVNLPDVELLQRMFAAKNGGAVARLYHGEHAYGSASEADVALCGHLAFWTGRDPVRMDSLFRASALMRDKWDTGRNGSTYGGMTIATAIANCPETYGSKATRLDMKRVAPSNGTTTDDSGTSREWLKFETEQGVAERFTARYGNDVRFVRANNAFYSWDRRYWEPDADGVTGRQIHQCARDLTFEALKTSDEEQKQKRVKIALQYETYRKQQAVLSIAREMKPIATTADSFDRDPLLFNVQNGTIELRTGKLREHRRGDMISKISPVEYDPAAKCPIWDTFLTEIFPGDPDLIEYMQRAIGYSLTGETREHKMFILYGKGSNGKGTFTNIIEKVTGDYGTTTSAETFIGRKEGAPTNDLARLYNVRFVSAAEAEDNKSLSEAFVKSITGGDPILARLMYHEFFQFVPMFKLWLSTNYKPNVRGADDGIWRRLALIPFNIRFPEETCDKHMPEKLEAELPGILAWAVRGAQEYLKTGLGTCAAVAGATAAYRSDMDTLGTFLEQCCIEEPGASSTSTDLLAAYNAWAVLNSERTISSTSLGRKMQTRIGIRPYRDGKKRGFHGLCLLPKEAAQTTEPPHQDRSNPASCDAFDALEAVLPNQPVRARRRDFSENGLNASNASQLARVSEGDQANDGGDDEYFF